MIITWDSEAEAIYIDLPWSKAEQSHTVEITDEISIDYDKNNNPTGIEILCVTKPEIEDITNKD